MPIQGSRRGERRDPGRWYRPSSWASLRRQPAPTAPARSERIVVDAAEEAPAVCVGVDLPTRIGTAAFAFRGYDTSNLGRSPELLAHPVYGPIVSGHLARASAIAAETLGRPVDLARRVREDAPSTLASFGEDVALIVAMELAQLALLEEHFGVALSAAQQCFGYSLGEMTALVGGGMFTLEQVLSVLLACADDCAALAEGTTLGVLFSLGPALPLEQVLALCTEVSGEGRGLVGASAYLSPNTALVIGQGDTLARLDRAIPEFLPATAHLRRKHQVLPPLHTPLVWQRNVPNRAATALYQIGGRLKTPVPRLVSCVTGAASYEPLTARDLLVRWADHPQLLWDVIDETLRDGVETVVHVGPAPNLIPATFQRLGNNVEKQLREYNLSAIGRGVGSRMNRYAWLSRILPSRAALLRAPYVTHVILEDWLLEQPVR